MFLAPVDCVALANWKESIFFTEVINAIECKVKEAQIDFPILR